MDEPIVIMVAGVSGSGKSTLGRHLAHRFGWEFVDGDDLHPSRNIAKMAGGVPLDDADRRPWLAAIGRCMDDWAAERTPGVIACSALRYDDRDGLRRNRPWLTIAFLTAPRDILAARLIGRQSHFMKASMLDSQLETEELPDPSENILILDATVPVPVLADEIATAVGVPHAQPQSHRTR